MKNVLVAACEQGRKPLVLAEKSAADSPGTEALSRLLAAHSCKTFFRSGLFAVTGSLDGKWAVHPDCPQALTRLSSSEELYLGAGFQISPARTGLILAEFSPEHRQKLMEAGDLLKCSGAIAAWLMKLDDASGCRSILLPDAGGQGLSKEISLVQHFQVM
ncbi:MAG: hypothetical protein ACOCV7_00575, partial [Desulfonatronovibrionaceae bacterium]